MWRRFRRSPVATVALAYGVFITAVAVFAPLLSPYDPNAADIANRLHPPGPQHLFGTDDVGRDVLTRMIHGSRVSLLVGFCATALSVFVGSVLGALAGYYGRAADWIVS